MKNKMKKIINTPTKKSCCGGGCGAVKTRASVMGGKLVLSLGKAINPVVWQTDLTDASMSAFEVIEKSGSKKDGSGAVYTLTMKTGKKKESVEIAPFSTKDDAVEALMATSAALHSDHTSDEGNKDARGAPTGNNARKKPLIWRIISVLCVLVVLWVIWLNLNHRQYYALDNAGMGNSAAPFAQEENGVPLSAEDVLRGRQ